MNISINHITRKATISALKSLLKINGSQKDITRKLTTTLKVLHLH